MACRVLRNLKASAAQNVSGVSLDFQLPSSGVGSAGTTNTVGSDFPLTEMSGVKSKTFQVQDIESSIHQPPL